jgi:hypothetical protein
MCARALMRVEETEASRKGQGMSRGGMVASAAFSSSALRCSSRARLSSIREGMGAEAAAADEDEPAAAAALGADETGTGGCADIGKIVKYPIYPNLWETKESFLLL